MMAGAINGNLIFDPKNNNPVSSIFSFITACDPSQSSFYAQDCVFSGGTCPATPNPYCPTGVGQLQGTGFDVWKLILVGGLYAIFKEGSGHFASRLEAVRATVLAYGKDRDRYKLFYTFDVVRDRRARREWVAPDRKP